MTFRPLPIRQAPASSIDGSGFSGGAASTADVSVLDEKCLDRLRELDPNGRNQLLARVFKAFEGSIERLLPQLTEARRSGDMPAVRLVAHTLKSSSAALGALRLSQLCADIEARSATTAPAELFGGEIAARLDAMELELQAVRAEIRRLQDES